MLFTSRRPTRLCSQSNSRAALRRFRRAVVPRAVSGLVSRAASSGPGSLGSSKLKKTISLAVLSATVAGLGACQQFTGALSSDAETKPQPTVLNTAEVYAPSELVIVAPANTLPGNNTLIQVAENSEQVIQVKAQDVPGSQLIYRLQDGEDMDKFAMDEETGDLRFKEVPDWESPTDVDQNNNYMVLWQVVSSSGGARSQFMVVKVTDLAD